MPRRVLQGTVVSNVCDKTVAVKVINRVKHPLYGKYVTRSTKYAAHDENNSCKMGETIRIRECPPRSKTKCWEVIE